MKVLWGLIPGWGQALLIVVAVGVIFSAGCWVGGAAGSVSVAKIETKVATDRANRSEAARQDEQQTFAKEQQHAAITLQAVDRFTLAQPARDLSLRTQLADAERLRGDAEQRAARYRAQAQADAAARGDLANQCAALDRQLADGRRVVAVLRGDLDRRDAEVALLVGQIRADRVLLGDAAPLSPGSPPPARSPDTPSPL